MPKIETILAKLKGVKMQLSKIETDEQNREIVKYKSGDFPFLIYTDEFRLFDEGYIRWHWHKDLQISYIFEDKICFQVNGEKNNSKPW